MSHSDAIAVIGMSCRFPGARNIQQFWDNLKNGIESLTRFSDQELTEAGVPPSQLNHPDYVRSGFILEDEDLFDASFFGYSPREAEIMDPQQRLFLETAWETLEDGGYAAGQYDGAIGVFAGSRMSSYLVNVMDSTTLTLGNFADMQVLIANDKDYLTSRVSFKLNLRGPSITVQSACSTSLVAVHQACDSLFLGGCDMALAGGVSLNLPQKKGYLFQKGMVFSPDGHCRVFDAGANGMVPGNGVGVVLLKRLEDALADRDAIHAVITGSAVNNDGSHKVGYTTPSIKGQLEVIREAQGVSGVSPHSISYIEAHGTGTVLGDPVETEALCRVFNEKTDKKGFCAIGSVKSNIGHLDTAAGIAGFIKTVLCLKHGYLVPSLNYEQPNPKIDFQNSPFYVNTRLLPWQANGYPRRAGVSSFGFGGTNAHVILEEAPECLEEQVSHHPLHLFTLSAKTQPALARQIQNYCEYLINNPDASIEEICFTVNTGRHHFSHRIAAVAESIDDLHLQLTAAEKQPSSNFFQGIADDQTAPNIKLDASGKPFDHGLLTDIIADFHALQSSYRLPVLWSNKEECKLLLSALGKLYVHGADIDWESFYHDGSKPRRIPLPTYPFERKRYWAAKTDISVAAEFDADLGENSFYEVLWQEKDYPKSGDDLSQKPGTWLIFADKGGIGLLLAETLRAHGNECVLVFTDNVTADFSHVFPSFDFQNPKAYQKLAETFQARSECRGIIHLWALDFVSSEAGTSEWLKASQDLACRSVFYLVQSIHRLKWPGQVPRLCLVTKGAQPVDEKDASIAVAQSPIWGLGKVIGIEHPDFDCLRLDLDPAYAEQNAASFFHELYSLDQEPQVAFRANRRYVPRIVKKQIKATSDKENSPGIFRNDATYLITGGLGALGIETTRWMADQNAGHIVLLSRNQPSEDAEHTLAALRKKINVSVLSADVTDADQLAAVFTAIEKDCPPLKGIIHAAGVLEPGISFENEKYSNYLKVTAPKIQGAWNLHQLSKPISLDFFICFSSVVTMWGIHGMASYTAANMFLDALSHYRKSMGLKGTTINWGPWSDIGVVAEYNMSERLAIQGIGTISPAQGIAFLKKVIQNDFNQIGVLCANWNNVINQYQNKAEVKIFRELETSQVDEPTQLEKTSDILTKLRNTSSSKRVPILLDYLRDQISTILRISKSQISGSDNLMQLGMDSLLFIELAKITETDLETRIPPRYFIQSPHIDALGEFILKHMKELDTDCNKSEDFFSVVSDPDNRFEPFNLTDIQQAYWIGRVNTLELGNIACHVYMEIDTVHLDYARYSQAWQTLILRHEMLRAIILPDGSQKILETVPPYQIKITDLTKASTEQAKTALASTRDYMSHQVLDPGAWPIFDIRVSRIDKETSKIHLSLDMLVVDALSVSQLMKELGLLYQGENVSLPPLELSFRDYVLAEKQFEASDLFQQSKAYWMNRLADIPPGPELPLIKNPGDVTCPHFKRRRLKLESDTWKQLKTKAANAGLTPSGLLLSCYAEILSTWSKSAKFTINMTIFNRLPVHPQVNDIIGDFTSLIMLVVDAGGQSTFMERAQKIQAQFWRDVEHRHFSGVAVLRELSRIQSENIAMPVVFTSNVVYGDMDEIGSDSSVIGDVVYTITQTPQVWLDHQITEQGNTLVLDWDAVEELFPEGMLDDMFNAYHSLLSRLAGSDDWHVNWDLVPADQVQTRKYIKATAQPSSPETLNTLFIKQVEQQPDHTAVITSSGHISYKDLHHKAMVVASQLAVHGASANTLVAVVMEKGWEQIVAVLGVLNAGAAYLPIDPAVPRERLRHLLKDGEVKSVLTQSWLDRAIEWPNDVDVCCVDSLDYTRNDLTPVQVKQTPDDLAYVIHTSGSTGLPKGVMIDHKGAVNTILDINNRYHLSSIDRVFALSNLNFDLSVYDIFGTLAAGATIVMPDDALRKDPGHWVSLVKEEHVTVWNSVPALMQMLVEYVSGRDEYLFDTLRLILLSGDWIPLDLPDNIRKWFDPAHIISLGGATEASIWSILYPVKKVAPDWNSIPYGRPMANQDFYVLNDNMAPCPDWVPGQLYIAGTGLAKGYWRDEKKTRDSFIQNPKTGEALYRTGDIGRFLPDGNIEFLGREDQQVKINGYRIELGEIEAAMAQYPGVKRAVANVAADTDKKQCILGYLVLDSGINISVEDLEQFLGNKLPVYMIPGAVMELDRLPLTPNGKIDRKNLPLPDPGEISLKTEYVPPETELEIQLAGTIQKILNIDKISNHDPFMSIGANSLDMVKIQNALEKELKIDVSVVDLFEHSSIHSLARFISGKTEEQAGSLQVQGKVSARKTAARKRHRKRERVL